MKKILLILSLVFLVACTKESAKTGDTKAEQTTNETKESGENMTLNQVAGYQEGNIKGKIVTNMGEMEIILFPNIAPKAVENFVTHAKNGYYEGIIFHRVIDGFMIQGGDPTGTGMGGESIWGKEFEDEFDVNYRHFHGAISMANAGPATNGSQFFIVTAKDNVSNNIVDQMRDAGEAAGYPEEVVNAYRDFGGTYHLDGRHSVFGHVTAGMDVAIAISQVDTNSQDKPLQDVVIEKIIIEE